MSVGSKFQLMNSVLVTLTKCDLVETFIRFNAISDENRGLNTQGNGVTYFFSDDTEVWIYEEIFVGDEVHIRNYPKFGSSTTAIVEAIDPDTDRFYVRPVSIAMWVRRSEIFVPD